MDSSQWPSLSEWDPEVKQANDANPRPPPDLSDVSQCAPMRQMMESTMKGLIVSRYDFTGVDQQPVDIPFRDGTSLPSLVYRPSASSQAGPLAVLVHGGGWFVGFPEMESGAVIPLVKEHGATVVSVEYRLAPEHPFPTPINDCWDALKWCAANASKLGADPSRGFLIGGSSAGGNAAAVLQHLARDEKLSPPLTACWLGYPGTLDPETVPEKYKAEYTSMEQNAEAPGFNKKAHQFLKKAYQCDPKSELWAPFNWPSGHAGLTRTYVQVCGMDPIRDDGLLYERELRHQGTETKLDVYPGCPHGVDIMYPDTAQGRKYEADRLKGFRWLLRKE